MHEQLHLGFLSYHYTRMYTDPLPRATKTHENSPQLESSSQELHPALSAGAPGPFFSDMQKELALDTRKRLWRTVLCSDIRLSFIENHSNTRFYTCYNMVTKIKKSKIAWHSFLDPNSPCQSAQAPWRAVLANLKMAQVRAQFTTGTGLHALGSEWCK